jgi:nucleoside-diphosphate-sugar epimerase
VNVGSGVEPSLRDLVAAVAEASGREPVVLGIAAPWATEDT